MRSAISGSASSPSSSLSFSGDLLQLASALAVHLSMITVSPSNISSVKVGAEVIVQVEGPASMPRRTLLVLMFAKDGIEGMLTKRGADAIAIARGMLVPIPAKERSEAIEVAKEQQ